MRAARLVCGLVLLGLLASVLYAADVSGQWKSQAGDDPPFSFTLKSDGGSVTGSMVGTDGKDRSISDGRLDGDSLSFSVASEWQGQPIKLVAKGKVSADQIQLHIGTDDGAWGTDTTLKRASK